ncbi:MAG TPA: hypothetical protein VGF75_04200 [Candidatus Saccharimonadales bacterium]|jgi:hypothetical protein
MIDVQHKNEHVIHPKQLIKPKRSGLQRFNNNLALKITNSVGSMWSAYLFALLSLCSLPAIIVLIDPGARSDFPKFIIAASVITLIAWISQNFLQLVLLPVIMVGQNVIQGHQEAKADADHKTLTYLANLQEEQMTELKNQGEILDYLRTKLK